MQKHPGCQKAVGVLNFLVRALASSRFLDVTPRFAD
tara:strand:- start:127796 stop:127903 length:108 start_codon:yes stop_codon:yes gene_type:complete